VLRTNDVGLRPTMLHFVQIYGIINKIIFIWSIERKEIAEIVYSDPEFYIGKYNKLIEYYPNMASKILKSLICYKPKSKI